jgi:CubicO group peptidase (beta-lactamase class C family)
MGVRRRAFLGGVLLSPLLAAGVGRPSAVSPAAADTAVPPPPTAADWAEYAEYLRGLAEDDLFSGTVLVARHGRVLLHEAVGWADRERGVRNTCGTVFCAGSMGKMFTGVAVARLVERGKVAFDDPLGAHVPGLPAEMADHVTVHHLLTHTAGMGDVIQGDAGDDAPTTVPELMELVAAEPLLFPPGTRHQYSNSGFIAAGAVVEAHSRRKGLDYAGYVDRHVFRPSGMRRTAVRAYRPGDVPGMAVGYYYVDADGNPLPPPNGPQPGVPEGGLHPNGHIRQVGNPSGGAHTTAADMLAFSRALMGGDLLSPEMTATVTTGKTSIGGPMGGEYGYGFTDLRLNGVRVVGHNGGTPGYEAQLDVYPDTGYTVVVLTNQDRALMQAMGRVHEMLTGGRSGPPPSSGGDASQG